MTSHTVFEPGTLLSRTATATAAALRCGALQPIPTECELVESGGMSFLVRVVSNLARKDQVRRAAGRREPGTFNPFLPYDPAMYVADASPTHVCLLNKFNVLEQHLLIITRQFELQETPLDIQDFTALWTCLAEYDGLGFYNAGAAAGASQRHKHLQLVPLPLASHGPPLPIEALLSEVAIQPEQIGEVRRLPFVQAFALFAEAGGLPAADAAQRTLTLYDEMLRRLDLVSHPAAGEVRTLPYNLLVTRRWLLLVPRLQESVESVSLNALAFAGALLVRNRAQLELLKTLGPMAALQQVAKPRP